MKKQGWLKELLWAEVANSWKDILREEFASDYFENLMTFLETEYAAGQVIMPEQSNILAVLKEEIFQIKVVILGQDPYPTAGVANGLAFSVNQGTRLPQSIRNIYQEIRDDIGSVCSLGGDLREWQKQGVFLLNDVLTVEVGKPGSHWGRGWEVFTDRIIRAICQNNEDAVFMLWGNNARKKKTLISAGHLVLEAAHPSPLSARRGFFGCKHFSQTNEFLVAHGKTPIKW